MSHSLHDAVLLSINLLANGDAVLAFENVHGVEGGTATLFCHEVTKIERRGGLPGFLWRVSRMSRDGRDERGVLFGVPDECSVIRMPMQQAPHTATPPAELEITCARYFLQARIPK